MIRTLFMLFFLAVLPSSLPAQNEYLEVTAPGSNLFRLTVVPPVPLGGSPDPVVEREVVDVLGYDLDLTGLVKLQPSPATAVTGIRPGDFSFEPWKAAGTDLVVKCGYGGTSGNVALECRLYDVPRGKELAAKRYTGKRHELRRMAHLFADEILRSVTGEAGPFGARIAFVSTATGNKEIYVMDPDGHDVRQITRNGSINLNPDFSPDGRELIFTSYQKRNPDLYRRDIASGAEARISGHRGVNISATWSPDGSNIALAMSKDGTTSIYVMDREGKRATRVTDDDDAISVSPAWSPDGSRLAFVSDRLGKPQVFIMPAGGGNARRLTTNGSYNVTPRWSPKGDRIAYCRQEGGSFHIYTISPDGTNDARLTSEGSNEHPRWSPDGRFITFSSRRGGAEAIYVMRADGSGQTMIYRGKGKASHPTWSRR